MALSQEKLREVVFHMIYSHDFAQNEAEDMIPFLMRQLEMSKKNICSAQEKAAAVCQKISEIDPQIAGAATEYALDRIPGIEKNILRLGVYEICFDEAIPPKVAIAEAIRLARKFATPESAAFVNAVLDVIYHNRSETWNMADCGIYKKGNGVSEK